MSRELSLSIKGLLEGRRPSVFAKEQSLLRQGETADCVFWALSGTASAIYQSPDGRPLWLGGFGMGALIGLDSVLTDSPACYEVRANTTMAAVAIPKPVFLDAHEAAKTLVNPVSLSQSSSLTSAQLALTELGLLTVKERIAMELLRRSKPDESHADRRIIRPVPSFVNMAFQMNTSRETVSRTVNDLIKDGVLVRSPGALLILRPGALRHPIQTDWALAGA